MTSDQAVPLTHHERVERARTLHRRLKREREAAVRAARRLGTHTPAQWEAMLSFCGGCVQCGAGDLPLRRDHILPVTRGESDAIHNIQPMCIPCNSSKGNGSSEDLRPAGWAVACGVSS